MDYDPDLNWKIVDDKGFNSHIGPLRYARTEDRWLGAIELADQHINFGGVCHGGVYMALADVTMGIAAHSVVERQKCATIDFQAHFLAAAKKGQVLMCAARLNRSVGGIIFMESELWASGRQCMRASGIWKVLAKTSKN